MQLCVALDLPSRDENISLVQKLKSFDTIWLKVGFRAYIRDGKPLLDAIKAINPKFKSTAPLKGRTASKPQINLLKNSDATRITKSNDNRILIIEDLIISITISLITTIIPVMSMDILLSNFELI